jgi:cytochrome P450
MTDTTSRARSVSYIDIGCEEAFVRDPITPLLELARREGPVVRGRGNEFGGVTVSNHFLMPWDRDAVLVLGYDAALSVLADGRTFSSAEAYAFTMGQTIGKVLFTMDAPEHTRYRDLVSRAFSPRNVNGLWMDRHVKPAIEKRLDAFADRGHGDLVTEFTMPFPYEVIASITGVPARHEARMAELTTDMLDMGIDPFRAMAAYQAMNEPLLAVIEEHRERRSEDMTTALLEAEVDGTGLTDEEVASFLRVLITAGLDTTYRASGGLLFELLTHPEQLEELRAHRELVDGAVEEAFRVVGPGGMVPRVATRDTEVAGVPVPAGTCVLVCLLAANYDETRWPDPTRFDIHRKPTGVMTFGGGAHACIGMALARGEIRYALNRLLDRLVNLSPDPELWPGAELRGFGFRSPTKLPAVWDLG